jgi:hypothetical protein
MISGNNTWPFDRFVQARKNNMSGIEPSIHTLWTHNVNPSATWTHYLRTKLILWPYKMENFKAYISETKARWTKGRDTCLFSVYFSPIPLLLKSPTEVWLTSPSGVKFLNSCRYYETMNFVVRDISTVNSKAVPLHVMEAHGVRRRYSSYSYLTSALDGGEWSASRPGSALPPGKDPQVPIGQISTVRVTEKGRVKWNYNWALKWYISSTCTWIAAKIKTLLNTHIC